MKRVKLTSAIEVLLTVAIGFFCLLAYFASLFVYTLFSFPNAFVVVATAPFILGAFFLYIVKHKRAWYIIIVGILTVLIACISAAILLNPDQLPIAATFFVGTGWIVTNVVSSRNTRTAHTLDVIRELRSNPQLLKHRINVFEKLGYNTKLTRWSVIVLKRHRDDCCNWKNEHPVFDSLSFIGNFYESIAYGIRYNNLDERVVRETARQTIVLFYRDYFEFIKYHHEQSRLQYAHLIYLAEKFGAPKYQYMKCGYVEKKKRGPNLTKKNMVDLRNALRRDAKRNYSAKVLNA